MKKAIVTLSGGIDSAVTAQFAKNLGYELYFLTLNYGQKNFAKEKENTKFFAKFFGAKEHKIINMTWLGKLGASAVTDKSIEFNGNNKDLEYIPYRNTLILSCATAWAEVMPEVEKIYIGSMAGPWICPDNSPQYFEIFNKLIENSTKLNKIVRVEAPLNYMDKPAIINKAIEFGIPLEHTWTCISNAKIPCGICPPCKNRIESFKAVGITDPVSLLKDGE